MQGSSDLHAKGSEWANTGAERGILSAFEIYATGGALLLDFIVPIIL